jgi:hypothetical protein
LIDRGHGFQAQGIVYTESYTESNMFKPGESDFKEWMPFLSGYSKEDFCGALEDLFDTLIMKGSNLKLGGIVR